MDVWREMSIAVMPASVATIWNQKDDHGDEEHQEKGHGLEFAVEVDGDDFERGDDALERCRVVHGPGDTAWSGQDIAHGVLNQEPSAPNNDCEEE
jgi:hypothetical protein